jgi:hypothetical protein
MSAAACVKIILNGAFVALIENLKVVLTDPVARAMLGDMAADAMLDELIAVEISGYCGDETDSTLQKMLANLVSANVLDDRIWKIYAPPA